MPLSGGVAVQGDDVWERVCAAQGLISANEVLRLDPAPLAQRCAAGEDVRLHASQALRFECRCSLERVSGMLRSLGAEELHDILREQGSVTVTCEFCQRPYRFDPVDIGQLLQSGDVAPAPSTRVN
jgi:molecular chaperone Hsp33